MNNILKWQRSVGLILLLPVTGFAGSGWTGYGPVAELIATNQLRYHLQLKVKGNASGCENKDMFYQDLVAPGAEQMFDTLLEAVASGKLVRIYVTGRCDINGYSEISSVGIVP